jgi:hypothetical protein
MAKTKDQRTETKGRSRVFFSVLSLICPGLGQIVRGRIFTGLLFLLNMGLYVALAVAPHNIEYDIRNPSLLVALGVWIAAALDAFLLRSSFLVMALLISLLCFGTGFSGALFVLPHLDI